VHFLFLRPPLVGTKPEELTDWIAEDGPATGSGFAGSEIANSISSILTGPILSPSLAKDNAVPSDTVEL